MTSTGSRLLPPVLVVAGLAVLVQVLVMTDVLPRRSVPAPTTVLGELAGLVVSRDAWEQLGQTLVGWGAALGIAVVVGTLLGAVLGRFAVVQALVTPVVEFLRPIPSIALIPLVILTIGGGKQGEVFLATYAALWQVLIAALYAVGSTDPVARETGRIYQLGAVGTFRWVTLPSMLPGLVTGIRIASAMALVIVITSQILIGSPGLGQGLNLARSAADVDRMYAYIVLIGVLGAGLNALLKLLERQVLHWHPSVREVAR